MIIMRKICKIEFSKINLNKNKLVLARNMKTYFGGVGERWVFLLPIASRGFTALCQFEHKHAGHGRFGR